tara:strand:- start:2804 stop:3190 length:387 start_codon:yes stop_codon:yes gene_type:complete
MKGKTLGEEELGEYVEMLDEQTIALLKINKEKIEKENRNTESRKHKGYMVISRTELISMMEKMDSDVWQNKKKGSDTVVLKLRLLHEYGEKSGDDETQCQWNKKGYNVKYGTNMTWDNIIPIPQEEEE